MSILIKLAVMGVGMIAAMSNAAHTYDIRLSSPHVESLNKRITPSKNDLIIGLHMLKAC